MADDVHPGLHHARRSNRARWIKRGLLAAFGIAILAAIVIAYLPRPVPVDVECAGRQQLEVTVEGDGKTRVRDRFVVAAPASGQLVRIDLEAGAHVDRGAALARIVAPEPAVLDPRSRGEAIARLAGAQAQERQAGEAIRRARAVRDLAVREAQRTRTLLERGAITAAERDRAELTEQTAIADLAAAEQQIRIAAAAVAAERAILGTDERPQGAPRGEASVSVTAPAAGTVLRIMRDSEGPIAAGTPILELGDPHDLEIVVDVLSSDAARIPIGARVRIEDWGGDRPVSGTVRVVEPSAFTKVSALGIEEQRVNVVIVLAATPERLGDAFRVTAQIELWRGEVLAVPTSALFRDHGAWAVYAIAAGHAVLRHVDIGHRGALDVEIARGLSEGDRVVIHPSDAVRDGVPVAAR